MNSILKSTFQRRFLAGTSGLMTLTHSEKQYLNRRRKPGSVYFYQPKQRGKPDKNANRCAVHLGKTESDSGCDNIRYGDTASHYGRNADNPMERAPIEQILSC